MQKIDRALIEQREQELAKARADLQEAFVGIDDVIDELIDGIRVWYLMPEVLSRPVILNLWGMTGVGKTDLVRKLVKSLGQQERFIEVELSNGDTTSYHSSVGAVLDRNGMNDDKPKIVLFDEIQRFNTLDADGKPLVNTKFTDFWELLSDGRLSKRERSNLDTAMSDFIYYDRDARRRKEKGEEVNVDEGIGVWEARNLKETWGLEGELDEVSDWTRTKALDFLKTVKSHKVVYEPVNHSQTLIIISGNLDDAFSMSTMTGEADIDADIFRAFTEKITVVDIKQSLTRRFKPEQVARFGNVHLIYRALGKASYEELIAREVARVIATTKEHFGITLTVDKSMNKLIYRNGVFAVQGVRPVFSSVSDILEGNLSKMIFEAIMSGDKRIAITYDEKAKQIVASLGKRVTINIPYAGRLDKVRDRNIVDVVANVSVHEAGHAVVYGALFGLAPLQLTSRVASSYASGFTFPHDIHSTRESMLNQIKVYLPGGLAEELVFGRGQATIGRASDRETATTMLLDFVRRYGFDDEYQATYTLDMAYAMDKSVTDIDAEKMMSTLVAETRQLLNTHEALLRDLSLQLLSAGKLAGEVVAATAGKHGMQIAVMTEGHLHIAPYNAELTA
jgi:rubrerythrin